MGVYINIEMPKACYECRMYEADIYYCAAAERDIDIPSSDEGRCSFCPLVPVPPHGDLIDRDALEQDAQKRLLMCNKNDNQIQKPYEVMRAIALAHTIISAEEGET